MMMKMTMMMIGLIATRSVWNNHKKSVLSDEKVSVIYVMLIQNGTDSVKLKYKASPKRYRTFAIARQWAGAGRLRRWCCVAWTLSFILTLTTSRHFQWVMSYAALIERVFSALGDFMQVEEWRILKSNVFAWNSVWSWEKPNYLLRHFSESNCTHCFSTGNMVTWTRLTLHANFLFYKYVKCAVESIKVTT